VLIGILSDSHGHDEPVRRAVDLFDRLGVELIVHCGDVGDADVFDQLVGHNFRFVWGNMDRPTGALRAYLKTVAVPLPEIAGNLIEVGGKRIAVFHGHESAFHRAVNDGTLRDNVVHYIFHGHTHRARNERIGTVRVINPGALHRAKPKTVATLDTQTDQVEFHEIKW
jgi:putative phosphoesterase